MKALSLWQPWASAIPLGLKRIETRGRPTNYRGRLAIHAAKTQRNAETGDDLIYFWRHSLCVSPSYALAFARHGIDTWFDLPFGAIIATCDLVDCVPSEQLLADGRADEQEQHWGNFGPGRYGWLLDNVVKLKTPVPLRGMQGLFEWKEAA